MINVLNEFGFESINVSPDVLNKPDQILQLGRPPMRIDIITSLSGVTFEECERDKKRFEIDSMKLPVIGIEQLKKNKKASGRHKDLDDLEHL